MFILPKPILNHLPLSPSSVRASLPAGHIEEGLEVTRSISTQANNAIHLSLIEGGSRTRKFGALVLQDVFLSHESHRQVYKERRVFLFEKALIIAKRRRKEEAEVYAIKDQLMVSRGVEFRCTGVCEGMKGLIVPETLG